MKKTNFVAVIVALFFVIVAVPAFAGLTIIPAVPGTVIVKREIIVPVFKGGVQISSNVEETWSGDVGLIYEEMTAIESPVVSGEIWFIPTGNLIRVAFRDGNNILVMNTRKAFSFDGKAYYLRESIE